MRVRKPSSWVRSSSAGVCLVMPAESEIESIFDDICSILYERITVPISKNSSEVCLRTLNNYLERTIM